MKLKNTPLKMLWTRSLYSLIAVALTACGSTYNTTDTDGIYGENTTSVAGETDHAKDNEQAKNSYYQQYFKTKSQSLEEIPEDDLIFTDIEAYSSNESLDEEGYVVVEETGGYNGYAGWGDNTTDVSVNVYGGYGGWGGGWGIGFGWGNPYWGWGSAWGYPYWGWGGYWGWYGGYNPWYCAYPTPYYYNNYGHGGYAHTYNRGRRNTDYLAARSSRGAEGYARSNTSRIANRSTGRYGRTAGRYGRSEMARRSNARSGSYASMRNSARGNSARYNPSTRSNYRSSRGNTVNRSRNSANRNYNRNNMRNTNRSRPARSYSRPSGSMRSSGGGYRGGGGSRGGGRAGGGRGGRG